jgi:predicted AlkP superfamily phosphohydrolase/phosphomutase
MPISARVLFIGIDAASKTLVETWAGLGLLPTLRALLANGLVGDTESVEGFFVGSTWPSFYTGVSPARHGFHSLIQLEPGTYDFRRCDPGDCVKREPFWAHLSRAGRRVAILDIPLTGIARGLNGMQMVEWGAHDAIYGFRAWPPALTRQVKAKFGLHPLTTTCDVGGRTPQDFVEFTSRLVEGVRKKAALTRYYLRQGGWDFFAQVFTEAHCVGHQCWHLHDPAHPSHDPDTRRLAGDPIQTVYVAIDAAIADILHEVGPDTLVVLLVGHGMAHRFGAQFLLRQILTRLGVAAPPPAEPGGVTPLLGWWWRHTPPALRHRWKPLRDRVWQWLDRQPPRSLRLDPRRDKCFLVDNGLAVGALRLNLIGREPRGLVEPGPGEEAFSAELARDLGDIVDLESGQRIVNRAIRTADLYQGEYRDRLPDLLVEWNDETPVGNAATAHGRGAAVRVASPKIGVIQGINTYCRTGDHRREGLFIATGAGISAGRVPRRVSITDFAPSFATILDVDLPDCDGRPIAELLTGV